MKNLRPLGLVVFGTLLVSTSLILLYWLPEYDLYKQINHEWPEPIIRIRFIGSYIFRLVGLSCGIGILCLKEPFRRLLLGLSYYSLATLPLRHTYQSQLFFSKPIFDQYGSVFSLEVFIWIAVIIHWIIDGAFSAMVIFYFKKPEVIQYFRKSVD